MSFVEKDWVVLNRRDVRYVGDDHDGPAPSYATPSELHSWLTVLTCKQINTILRHPTPSIRITPIMIELLNGFNIDDRAAEHLYGGSVQQGEEHYGGVCILGDAVDVDIFQDGKWVEGEDWWRVNADRELKQSHLFTLKYDNHDELCFRTYGSNFSIRAFQGMNYIPLRQDPDFVLETRLSYQPLREKTEAWRS